ncbi:MAG TPA: DUF1800 domain-containing protein [Acidimicrobiales bacterium]
MTDQSAESAVRRPTGRQAARGTPPAGPFERTTRSRATRAAPRHRRPAPAVDPRYGDPGDTLDDRAPATRPRPPGRPPASGPPAPDARRDDPTVAAVWDADGPGADLLFWADSDPRNGDPGPGDDPSDHPFWADGAPRNGEDRPTGSRARRRQARRQGGVAAAAATPQPAGGGPGGGSGDEEDGGGGDGGGSDGGGGVDGRGDRARPGRRAVLAALAGGGAAGLTWYATANGLAGTRGSLDGLLGPVPPPPPPAEDRHAAFRAADAGGFANRDESYARSAMPAEPVAPEPPPARARPTTLFPTAAEAAERTEPQGPTILATDEPIHHLLRRTTFGPTPALVEEVRSRGIDAWLADQLDPSAIDDAEADAVWAQFPMASMTPAQIQGAIERYRWDAMAEYGQATLARQIWSRRQLFEVMVDFWANHFNTPTPGEGGWDTAPSYHNDVIRRHALGSFTDMLLAVARHPSMLRYLSNHDSHKDSVNENYGRELLELHTVGVQAGYSEDDVRNSAYILTGRTVAGQDDEAGRPESTFYYDPERHWTGPVRVLDFQHANASPEGGLEVGDAYLRYLATHPATARTIARKLAVRFVSDDPPDVLVDRLAETFLESGTQIVPVLQVLFRSGEFWAAVGQKTRRPLENIVASARAVGVRPGPDTRGFVESLYWRAGNAGHKPLAWPAPNGYPDVQAAWRSANGLLEAWNVHRALVGAWEEGATYTPAEALAGDGPQATVGAYVDTLCRRLCLQTFRPEHRNVLVAFLEAGESAPIAEADLHHSAGHLVPLVLDSPYFALR